MLKGMSLRGSLSTMSAEDVLEWVSEGWLSAPITFEASRAGSQPR